MGIRDKANSRRRGRERGKERREIRSEVHRGFQGGGIEEK